MYDNQKQTGRSLFFLHGNSLGAFTFKHQLNNEILDWRLISIDLPGHGYSAKSNVPEHAYTMQGFINTVAEVVQSLKLEKVVFAGHSFGAHLLLEGFNRLEDFAAGIIIFGAPPMAFPPAFNEITFPHEAIGLLFKQHFNAIEVEIICKALIKKNAEPSAEIIHSLINTHSLVRKFLGEDLAAGNTKDETEIISKINIPVAIFHGSEDQLINPEYYSKLNIPKLWRDKIHYIKNTGHLPQLENPEDFNLLLSEFCKDVFE